MVGSTGQRGAVNAARKTGAAREKALGASQRPKKDPGGVAEISDAIRNFKRPKKDSVQVVLDYLKECDTLSPAPALKLPKELAVCADLGYTLREARLRLKKKLEALESMETQIDDHIIDNLPKSKAGGITGAIARATIVRQDKPRVEDWTKFYAHVAKTESWDLMQKRLNDGAVKERWEAKKKIPGVGTFTVVKVSLTKA